jgi:hypothetical protein
MVHESTSTDLTRYLSLDNLLDSGSRYFNRTPDGYSLRPHGVRVPRCIIPLATHLISNGGHLCASLRLI